VEKKSSRDADNFDAEEETMKFEEIRVIAKSMGIQTARLRKADAIRAIQESEGNFVCFGTAADGYCDQGSCAWRKDCVPEVGNRCR
jgi:hypothetical protein